MFKLSNTFRSPTQGSNAQRGFPTPGSGAQRTGQPTFAPREAAVWYPEHDYQGLKTWDDATDGSNAQRGGPVPGAPAQRRPPGSMPNVPPIDGLNTEVYTPYFSRGAAAYVQNYGKVLTNPIGAGIVAKYRPQATYGSSGQYINGAIWWTSQVIPTSINTAGLADPDTLLAILGTMNVQAVVRTTG